MKPTTYLLWLGPFVLLVLGITILVVNLKRRKALVSDAPLSEDEANRLKSLLDKKQNVAVTATGEELKS